MQVSKIEGNLILRLSIDFALNAIAYCDELESKRKYVISNQLLKAATSIGANLFEAQNAESKSDFIHKVKIAAKEVDETKYWLILCGQSKNYPEIKDLFTNLESIERVITKILSSSKKSLIKAN